MSLDREPWIERGEILILEQKDWVPKYNNSGRVMAAVPDYYSLGRSGNVGLIRDLRRNFVESCIIPDMKLKIILIWRINIHTCI